jgi:hypothetical protein
MYMQSRNENFRLKRSFSDLFFIRLTEQGGGLVVISEEKPSGENNDFKKLITFINLPDIKPTAEKNFLCSEDLYRQYLHLRKRISAKGEEMIKTGGGEV